MALEKAPLDLINWKELGLDRAKWDKILFPNKFFDIFGTRQDQTYNKLEVTQLYCYAHEESFSSTCFNYSFYDDNLKDDWTNFRSIANSNNLVDIHLLVCSRFIDRAKILFSCHKISFILFSCQCNSIDTHT